MGLSLQTTPFTSQTVIYAFVNIKIWISAALISLFVVVVWFFRRGFSSVVVVVCNLWKCHWKQFSFSFPFLQTHNETTSQVQCKGITKPTHLVQNELKHKHYNKPTTQFQYSITLSHAVAASGVFWISEPDADVAARLGHNQTCHMCV